MILTFMNDTELTAITGIFTYYSFFVKAMCLILRYLFMLRKTINWVFQ